MANYWEAAGVVVDSCHMTYEKKDLRPQEDIVIFGWPPFWSSPSDFVKKHKSQYQHTVLKKSITAIQQKSYGWDLFTFPAQCFQ